MDRSCRRLLQRCRTAVVPPCSRPIRSLNTRTWKPRRPVREMRLGSHNQFSLLMLSRMTHQEMPWQNAWGERPQEGDGDDPIRIEDLEDFFRKQTVPRRWQRMNMNSASRRRKPRKTSRRLPLLTQVVCWPQRQVIHRRPIVSRQRGVEIVAIKHLRGTVILVVQVPDKNGVNPKDRFVVLVRDFDDADPLVYGVAVTGTFAFPLPPTSVRLPYHRQGRCKTGLTQDCIADCTWIVGLHRQRS